MHLHGYSSAFPRTPTQNIAVPSVCTFGPRRAHVASQFGCDLTRIYCSTYLPCSTLCSTHYATLSLIRLLFSPPYSALCPHPSLSAPTHLSSFSVFPLPLAVLLVSFPVAHVACRPLPTRQTQTKNDTASERPRRRLTGSEVGLWLVVQRDRAALARGRGGYEADTRPTG